VPQEWGRYCGKDAETDMELKHVEKHHIKRMGQLHQPGGD